MGGSWHLSPYVVEVMAEASKEAASPSVSFWDGLLQNQYQQLKALELAAMGKVSGLACQEHFGVSSCKASQHMASRQILARKLTCSKPAAEMKFLVTCTSLVLLPPTVPNGIHIAS